ncbi:hypothetical protein VP01_257g2 [Puccinia sorghi]|uniref:Uncharacterized protein n=1 Tax=Puccinia sorghi TaxID=27349 RepID=A0A0L6V4Y9_9BASI|nr:hypothetical protein VP01_257g2 [Puccinia sorghi]
MTDLGAFLSWRHPWNTGRQLESIQDVGVTVPLHMAQSTFSTQKYTRADRRLICWAVWSRNLGETERRRKVSARKSPPPQHKLGPPLYLLFLLGYVWCNRLSGVKQNSNIEEIDFNHNLVSILPVGCRIYNVLLSKLSFFYSIDRNSHICSCSDITHFSFFFLVFNFPCCNECYDVGENWLQKLWCDACHLDMCFTLMEGLVPRTLDLSARAYLFDSMAMMVCFSCVQMHRCFTLSLAGYDPSEPPKNNKSGGTCWNSHQVHLLLLWPRLLCLRPFQVLRKYFLIKQAGNLEIFLKNQILWPNQPSCNLLQNPLNFTGSSVAFCGHLNLANISYTGKSKLEVISDRPNKSHGVSGGRLIWSSKVCIILQIGFENPFCNITMTHGNLIAFITVVILLKDDIQLPPRIISQKKVFLLQSGGVQTEPIYVFPYLIIFTHSYTLFLICIHDHRPYFSPFVYIRRLSSHCFTFTHQILRSSIIPNKITSSGTEYHQWWAATLHFGTWSITISIEHRGNYDLRFFQALHSFSSANSQNGEPQLELHYLAYKFIFHNQIFISLNSYIRGQLHNGGFILKNFRGHNLLLERGELILIIGVSPFPIEICTKGSHPQIIVFLIPSYFPSFPQKLNKRILTIIANWKGVEAEDNPPVGETPGKSQRGLQGHNKRLKIIPQLGKPLASPRGGYKVITSSTMYSNVALQAQGEMCGSTTYFNKSLELIMSHSMGSSISV